MSEEFKEFQASPTLTLNPFGDTPQAKEVPAEPVQIGRAHV